MATTNSPSRNLPIKCSVQNKTQELDDESQPNLVKGEAQASGSAVQVDQNDEDNLNLEQKAFCNNATPDVSARYGSSLRVSHLDKTHNNEEASLNKHSSKPNFSFKNISTSSRKLIPTAHEINPDFSLNTDLIPIMNPVNRQTVALNAGRNTSLDRAKQKPSAKSPPMTQLYNP